MKRILALAIPLLVAGCSTTPIAERDAKPVPTERIYAPEFIGTNSAVSKAHVSFFRDAGFYGAGCSHDIYVNNIKIFAIRQGEHIHLSLEPGPYFFRLETGAGLCPNIATSQNTILKAGDKESYRILLPSDGGLRLTRTE